MIGSGGAIINPLRAKVSRKPPGYRPDEGLPPAFAFGTHCPGRAYPRQLCFAPDPESLVGRGSGAGAKRDMFDLPGARRDRQLLQCLTAIGPPYPQLRNRRCITIEREEKVPVSGQRNRLAIEAERERITRRDPSSPAALHQSAGERQIGLGRLDQRGKAGRQNCCDQQHCAAERRQHPAAQLPVHPDPSNWRVAISALA